MPVGIVSVSDGPQITVSELIKNPLFIPTKLLEMLENTFLAEQVFRNAGGNDSGVVTYRQNDPLFLDTDLQDLAEYGEIPIGASSLGDPRVAFATRKGIGVRVSKEMIDENAIDQVNLQMTGVKNTFLRGNDRAFRALAADASVPTTVVPATWSSTGKPRSDVMRGIEAISSAAPSGLPASQSDEYFGFDADTMVMHPSMLIALAENTNFNYVYNGNVADQAPDLTGKLPTQMFGLNTVLARTWPLDQVLICQKNVFGFYSDTRPLQFTALYAEGGGPNGGPRETWRSDGTQKRAMGIDQPKAAMWLKGLV